MTKEEAWQRYQEEIMPTKRGYVYPLEGAFYKTWSRAWDEAVERCAQVCEDHFSSDGYWCAQAIRGEPRADFSDVDRNELLKELLPEINKLFGLEYKRYAQKPNTDGDDIQGYGV